MKISKPFSLLTLSIIIFTFSASSFALYPKWPSGYIQGNLGWGYVDVIGPGVSNKSSFTGSASLLTLED